MLKTQYTGKLRARITILSETQARVEWITSAGDVIWTETVSPAAGVSFVSQIECDGEFAIRSGYFVDQTGKRHFILRAEPGRMGAFMQR